MKRTLDQLAAEFDQGDAQRQETAVAAIYTRIIAHLTDLAHWRINDMNEISCSDIEYEKNNHVHHHYYTIALNRASGRFTVPGFLLTYGGGNGWCSVRIMRQTWEKPLRQSKRRSDALTARSIFEGVWERDHAAFEELIQGEVARLVDFLALPDNWDGEKRCSKPWKWAKPFQYGRNDTYREIERLVKRKMDTPNYELKFCERGFDSTVQAKLKRV